MPQINSKDNPNQFIGEYHLKLKLKGSKSKIAFFHHILGDNDRDYPFKAGKEYKECDECGGVIYPAPRFNPVHLIGLSRQICATDLLPGRLKLRIKRFCTLAKCKEDAIKRANEKLGKVGSGGPITPPISGQVGQVMS